MDVKRALTGKGDEPCTWCKKKTKRGVKHITYYSGVILGSHKLCKRCEDMIEENGLAAPATPASAPTPVPTSNNMGAVKSS